MPSAKFNSVYTEVGQIAKGPTNDEQLDLYAWAKVAKGEDISAAKVPGMFDLKSKATKKRWQEVVDAGVTQKDAEQKYIALGEQLCKTHTERK
ncbi:acyl-CoA-binding protein [Massariosphaeria phaeospora]|uniref:Acyl-CoA-binding protein n=1 Tax=Massariosphaeria phaeospora TaxID=100035 RepID=A0A7C8MUS4_9PLEO|nr:acyl-CoA-binding protein [Massariosphaeria phaeospora]